MREKWEKEFEAWFRPYWGSTCFRTTHANEHCRVAYLTACEKAQEEIAHLKANVVKKLKAANKLLNEAGEVNTSEEWFMVRKAGALLNELEGEML